MGLAVMPPIPSGMCHFAPVMKKENIMNKIRMMSVLVILALISNVSPAYAAHTWLPH
jgi:hypothetical protein